jgi:DNA-binding LytR/AlgR family response regulator
MPSQKVLQKFINDVEFVALKRMFYNALDALDYLHDNHIDLIFLDIHLPKLTGIDFLTVLPQKPFIIITTAFPDYAIKGYELDVVDYLLKPFSFERFLKAVLKVEHLKEKAITPIMNKKVEHILIKVGYDLIRIQLNNITHIQADGNYTYLYCENKKYHASYTLKHWIDNLPGKHFLQVHRSFIVNLRLVNKVTSNSIELNKNIIPLGRVYKKAFQEAFLKIKN